MVTVEHLDLTMPDGNADSLYAAPDGPACPPVLFIMDAIGLRPRIEQMVAHLAGHGYAVLAPNVFYRAGRQPLVDPALLSAENRDLRMARFGQLFGSLTPTQWAADGAAYLAHVDALTGTGPTPIRVVGYCMGGRLGLALAAAHPGRIAALAGFHPGGLVTDAEDSPHRRLARVRARCYFGYADQDTSMTAEHQLIFAESASAAGVSVESDCYSGALHGYTMSDLPAYDAAATQRHWADVLRLFAEPVDNF